MFSQVLNVKNIFPLFVTFSTPEQEMEERKCNYERYRGLVQNDFANSEYQRRRESAARITRPTSAFQEIQNRFKFLIFFFTISFSFKGAYCHVDKTLVGSK